MFVFVRDLAGRWAEQRFVRANEVLRSKLKLAEAKNERLSGSLARSRVRRGIDREVRVRAERENAELTKANSQLSGLLFDAWQAVPAPVDPVAVGLALEVRGTAANTYVSALEDYLAADAAYRASYLAEYVREGGPEHARKALAEQATADLRAARDAAEVAKASAEESRRLAELGFRAAMAGAAPDGGES